MGCGCHFGQAAQQGYVLRAAVEFIVGNGRGDRLATRGVVLLGVGMEIQAALGNFRRVFEVLNQMFLTDIQQFDPHVLAKIGLVDQRLHAAPGRLYTLEVRMMHDGVKLPADLCIEGRDMLIEQHLVQALDFMRRLFEQVKEYTYSCCHPFIRRGFRQGLGVLKSFNRSQLGNRAEVNLGKQGAVYTLCVICIAGFSVLQGCFFYRHDN